MNSFFQKLWKGLPTSEGEDKDLSLLQSISKTLEKTADTLGKAAEYLSKKGREIGAEVKDRASRYSEQASGALKNTREQIREVGFKAYAHKAVDDLAGKFRVGGDTDPDPTHSPPEELGGLPRTTEGGIIGRLQISIHSLIDSLSGLKKVNEDTLDNTLQEQRREEVERKKSMRESMLDKMQQARESRMSRRRKEVEEEKAGARKDKKDKGKGLMGGLLGGLFSGLKTVVGGVASLMGSAVSGAVMFGLRKVLPAGIRAIFGRLVPSLTGLLAKGTWGAVKSVAGMGARALGGLAVRAATTVGIAALANPVGAAVVGVAALAAGAVWAYKRFTRNDVSDNFEGQLTRARLLAYGFADSHKDHYYKLFQLEELMNKYVSGKDGKAVYKPFDDEFKKSVLEIFGINRNNKSQYQSLNTWYLKRFIPAYGQYANAFYAAGGTTNPGNVEKMTGTQRYQLVTFLNFPNDIHDHQTLPCPEAPQSTVTVEHLQTQMQKVRDLAKKGAKETRDQNPQQTQAENRQNQAKAQAKAAMEQPLPQPAPKTEIAQKAAPELLAKPAPTSSPPLVAQGEAEPEKAGQSGGQGASAQQSTSAPTPPHAGGALERGPVSMDVFQGDAVKQDRVRQLDPDMLHLLHGMAKEYQNLTGKPLTLNEGFRTREDQERLRRIHGEAAAKPGTSLHEFGIAVDIARTDAAQLEKLGLMRKYGFTRPVGGEAWHVEPAGIALNPFNSKKDLAARKQAILSSPGRGGGGYGTLEVPKSQKYRRNIPLQKKLFQEGSTPDENLNRPQDSDAASSTLKQPIPTQGPTGQTPTQTTPQSPVEKTADDGLPVFSRELPTLNTEAEPPSVGKSIPQDKTADDGLPIFSREMPTFNTGSSLSSGFAPTSKPMDKIYPGLDKPPTSTIASTNNLDIGKVAEGSIEDQIRQASKVVGINPDTMLTFAKVESSLRPTVKAGTSNAKGLFQIVPDTWNYLVGKYASKYGLPMPPQIDNPYHNAVLGAAYAKENLNKLPAEMREGLREDTALYLLHHFGPTGGRRLMTAYRQNPQGDITTAVSQRAFKDNHAELAGKNVAGYIQYLDNKLTKASNTPSSAYQGGKASQAQKQSPVKTPEPVPDTKSSSQASVPPSETLSKTNADTASTTPTPAPAPIKAVVTPPQPENIYRSYSDKSLPDAPAPVPIKAVVTPPQPENIYRSYSDKSPPTAPPTPPKIDLGSTEQLLGGMSTTLVQIRDILSIIQRQPGGMSAASEGPRSSSSGSQPQTQGRGSIEQGELRNRPSQYAVNLLRKSILEK